MLTRSVKRGVEFLPLLMLASCALREASPLKSHNVGPAVTGHVCLNHGSSTGRTPRPNRLRLADDLWSMSRTGIHGVYRKDIPTYASRRTAVPLYRRDEQVTARGLPLSPQRCATLGIARAINRFRVDRGGTVCLSLERRLKFRHDAFCPSSRTTSNCTAAVASCPETADRLGAAAGVERLGGRFRQRHGSLMVVVNGTLSESPEFSAARELEPSSRRVG